MKRFALTLCAFAALLIAGATTASAQIVELGQTVTPLSPPACPRGASLAACHIVLVHTTALQTASDGVLNPTVVKQPGWVVAFSVGLSNLINKPTVERQILHGLDKRWGGPPQVALTVLAPVAHRANAYRVVGQSPAFHVIPFLGSVLSEPLSLPPTFSAFTALPVAKGDVIGLTVPTWAPVLAYNLNGPKFTYRQSRATNCGDTPSGQTAQETIGASATYGCSYPGARIEYSATEIVDQPYPRTYVH